MENKTLTSSELTVIASDVKIEGKVSIFKELHLYGKISGELFGAEGSLIILKEGSTLEGKIHADHVIIDGFVNGEILVQSKLEVLSRARVLGSIRAATLKVDPGAIFEAKVKMY